MGNSLWITKEGIARHNLRFIIRERKNFFLCAKCVELCISMELSQTQMNPSNYIAILEENAWATVHFVCVL